MLEGSRKFTNKPLCLGDQRSKSLSGISCRVYAHYKKKDFVWPKRQNDGSPKTSNNSSGKPERHWKDKLRESDNGMCEISGDLEDFCCDTEHPTVPCSPDSAHRHESPSEPQPLSQNCSGKSDKKKMLQSSIALKAPECMCVPGYGLYACYAGSWCQLVPESATYDSGKGDM